MTESFVRLLARIPLVMLAGGLAVAAPIVAADPPARVGRLSYASGVVSFSPAGDDQWAQAVRNRPIIAGDRLWSDRDGRVEIEFGSGAVRAGATTSLDVVNIDAGTAQFELTQGAIDLRVRRLARGEIVEVDTPNLAFQATQPGRYRVEVDPQRDATVVVVRDGAADVFGERVSYVVDRGQGYRFFGTDLADPQFLRPHGIDALDRFAQERDARFARAVSSRYVSPAVVGYEDLDRYGTWRRAGDYGNVWFPQDVPTDWAPYRDGHWSWIDPWGWTWVDDAPWGFAPFHYGRWTYVENRWGWVPGPVDVQPVYAPALVAFVGGATLAVAAASGPAIGWFPLAPREVYRPAYAVSRDYYRAVNVSNTVVNTTIINNTYVTNFTAAPPPREVSYANLRVAHAITAVPPSALAESRPVKRAAVPLPARTIDVAQVTAAAQVAPSRTAFVGAAPAARARPPERAREQAVVAKTAPPPAPMPVAQKLPLLERTPGRPLTRTDVPADRATAPAAPPRNVKVVETQRPAARQAPPAIGGPAPERGRPSEAADSPAPTAPAARSVSPAQRERAQEPAARPPAPAPNGTSQGVLGERPQAGPGATRETPPPPADERRRGGPTTEARPAPGGRPGAQDRGPAPRAEPAPTPAPAPKALPSTAPAPAAPPREAPRERSHPEQGPPPRPASAQPPPPSPAPPATKAQPQAPEPQRPAQRPPEAQRQAPAARPPEPARPAPPSAAPPPAARPATQVAPATSPPPQAQQREERGPDANRGKGRDKKDDKD